MEEKKRENEPRINGKRKKRKKWARGKSSRYAGREVTYK